MRKYLFISLYILSITQFSCERIKDKSKDLIHQTKEKVKEKSDAIGDKIIPKFDAYTPDTKYNKIRFKDFLKVPVTEDVKNIYCSSATIGIDASYQFSFNCTKQTAERIIKNLELKIDNSNEHGGYGLHHEFKWWDLEKIKTLPLYLYTLDHTYFRCFWYDEATKKGYFFDYDM